MKNEEVIEIPNGLEEQVTRIIKTAGIQGLNIEKAVELGAIDRISNMLCLMHSCICVAYRVYGNVDYMLETLHGKKHDINRACKQFEKDYERFMNFWRRTYQTTEGAIEMNHETEKLYHQVMRWAQFPEDWQLGDNQYTEDNTDVMVYVPLHDVDLRLHRTTVESEPLSEPIEKWCVTKLEVATHKQTTVYTDIDKASAMMSAKRLSAEDTENIYTATILHTINERRTDALPMKAYMGGECVGKVGKEFKRL